MAGKTLAPAQAIPAGRGICFISEAESAEPFEVASINPADPSTWPTGWVTPGLTSKDNKLSLSKDGGETETYDAWEMDAVDFDTSPATTGFTIKTLEQNKETWNLLHAGGSYIEALKAYGYTDTQAVTKSVQIVFCGGSKRGGIYWNQVSLTEGDAMEVGDGLIEQTLAGTVIAPKTGKHRVIRFEGRKYVPKSGTPAAAHTI